VDLCDGESVLHERLKAAAFTYFDECAAAGRNPDGYFNMVNTIALPTPDRALGNMRFWEPAIQIALDWEAERKNHHHKGSGFYVAGMRDIMLGNLDRAFLYMNQAARDDAWPDPNGLPDSPAGWFLTFDKERADQAGYELVVPYADYVERHLVAFRDTGRGALTRAALRDLYRDEARLAFPMIALGHAVARLVQIEEHPAAIHTSRFSALFRSQAHQELCMVIEEVLAIAFPVAGDTFGKLVRAYAPTVGMKPDDVSRFDAEMRAHPDGLLDELLDGTKVTAYSGSLTEMQADLMVALVVRNKSAHGLDRPADRRHSAITPRLFYVLFGALEHLYSDSSGAV
jgi:hypothetical protein